MTRQTPEIVQCIGLVVAWAKIEYYTAQPNNKYSKLPWNWKEGQLGDLLDRAMQKHVIRTIQQEETEGNKEKYNKGHRRRRITNGCDAIHNEYYHIPK